MSADSADVAGGHKPCSRDTGTEAGCQSFEETCHINTFPYASCNRERHFMGCWLQWQSQVKELPPSNHVALPTHALSRGTLNWGTEATPHTAVPAVLGLAAVNKHRPAPPANSGAPLTAWQLFQPRSPGTSTMQKAQKVPSSKHRHLRYKKKGKVGARRDGAVCSEQV